MSERGYPAAFRFISRFVQVIGDAALSCIGDLMQGLIARRDGGRSPTEMRNSKEKFSVVLGKQTV